MHIKIRRVLIALSLALFASVGLIGFAAYSSGYFTNAAIYATDEGAIDGYDPVAYFSEGVAMPGSSQFIAEHEGVIWRFRSAQNKRLFLNQPDKYMPQYGGFCAYARSEDYTAYSDPTAWAIESGRLYLNYSHDVKAEWDKDRVSRITKADGNWKRRQAEITNHE